MALTMPIVSIHIPETDDTDDTWIWDGELSAIPPIAGTLEIRKAEQPPMEYHVTAVHQVIVDRAPRSADSFIIYVVPV